MKGLRGVRHAELISEESERAQFKYNSRIYERADSGKGGVPELAELGFKGSWLEWFMKETETFHGTFISGFLGSPWFECRCIYREEGG